MTNDNDIHINDVFVSTDIDPTEYRRVVAIFQGRVFYCTGDDKIHFKKIKKFKKWAAIKIYDAVKKIVVFQS